MTRLRFIEAPLVDTGPHCWCEDVLDIPILYSGCMSVGIEQAVRFSCQLKKGHKGPHKGRVGENVRVEWDREAKP